MQKKERRGFLRFMEFERKRKREERTLLSSDLKLNKYDDLDRILEFYNKPVKKFRTKVTLSLPYYKGIQLPTHLKWVTINAVSKYHFPD